ncbi:MAG TPA: glycerol-3-phosphate acyltransferase [Candidatus Cloacimonas sp.]|mgnify:FL=1|nr:glycerol-3-phosphate acyltransferase [Candidatus Cloacimonas sp.]
MIYLFALLIIIIAYLYGCFSTARVIAKSFRSLNVYKIGSGLADTENIYTNISKPLGTLVGATDVAKAYLFLMIVEFVLRFIDNKVINYSGFDILYSENIMLIYGLCMLIGHCLPYNHHFRGGRGIFTYMGMLAYFAFLPTLISAAVAWLIVLFFRQIRFVQYLIVILPVILYIIFYTLFHYHKDFPPYFITLLLGNAVVMGVLNIIVSKKLGEF